MRFSKHKKLSPKLKARPMTETDFTPLAGPYKLTLIQRLIRWLKR